MLAAMALPYLQWPPSGARERGSADSGGSRQGVGLGSRWRWQRRSGVARPGRRTMERRGECRQWRRIGQRGTRTGANGGRGGGCGDQDGANKRWWIGEVKRGGRKGRRRDIYTPSPLVPGGVANRD